jgi:hypothetical protein
VFGALAYIYSPHEPCAFLSAPSLFVVQSRKILNSSRGQIKLRCSCPYFLPSWPFCSTKNLYSLAEQCCSLQRCVQLVAKLIAVGAFRSKECSGKERRTAGIEHWFRCREFRACVLPWCCREEPSLSFLLVHTTHPERLPVLHLVSANHAMLPTLIHVLAIV